MTGNELSLNQRVQRISGFAAVVAGVVVWRRLMAPAIDGTLALLLDGALAACAAALLLFWWIRGTPTARPCTRVRDSERSKRMFWACLALFGIGGLGVTSLVVRFQERQIVGKAGARFDRLSERLRADLTRRVTLPVYGLNGARAAFVAGASLKREAFRSYVFARNVPAEFPGVLGFGLIKCVEADQLDAFIARERADGAPDFDVRRGDWDSRNTRAPHGVNEHADRLFIITYVDPIEPSRAA